ncbi:zinc finger and BTB domain-containing protein 1-like [Scyliorhinus canicula]|uniref:zinc finger and BTB domain-containing protein 1-like n=1 Tax=Scyliorhinus canicula TaxID=7830 RepID=UPI0018F2C44F|nr:zinc finger and BTB domain-containing protein 1-like [Scyliorhinus canicula]
MQTCSHSEHVLQQLCSQLEYGFLCDCSIAVGDVHFRAHRVVLAACSSYFHRLFVNQPEEASQVVLSSQAVSPDHFDLILQLMYTGRLDSSPSDPERFRASLSFLKLYNAALFPAPAAEAAPRERQSEEGAPLASSDSDPLVLGAGLDKDQCTPAAPPVKQNDQAPISIKAETPEVTQELQKLLCRHCDLAFEEQQGLSEHLQSHAEKPCHCPHCGLAFDCTQRLLEHVTSCLPPREVEEDPKAVEGWSVAPEVKREAELAERPGGDSCSESQEAAGKDAGPPGLKWPKVEDPEEEEQAPLVLELSGVTVVRVGGEEAGAALPPPLFEQAEDYELEEGEVRFPGDDDLVLENAREGGFFSSSDSSLDGDSELSEQTELSEDEDTPGSEGPRAPPMASAARGFPDHHTCSIVGTEERKVLRRRGKGWRCQACDGCHPSEDQPMSQLGARKAGGKKNGIATRSSSRRCVPEYRGCHGSGQQHKRQDPGLERIQSVECRLAKGSKAPASSKKGSEGAPGKPVRASHCKKGGKASEGKQQRHLGKTAAGSRKQKRLRKHSCEVCGKGFLKRGHLTQHLAAHGKERRFFCQVCGQGYPRERELRLHVATHTGTARYECQLCGLGNERKHRHLRHMTCHLTQGQALCQVCFEIVLSAADLEQHLESHFYPCGTCGEKFKLKKDMVTHGTSCWVKRLLDSELDTSSGHPNK